MKKALIAMSGGVDSSVAAYLCKKEGYDCVGATMKLFDDKELGLKIEHKSDKACCTLEDVEAARSVAYSLEMPFHVFNFTRDFKTSIIDKFVKTYQDGGTPNPCIDCNRYMKFEKFLHRAVELEIDYVVTGHYARIEYCPNANRYLLKKGIDESKDQSYALYTMTQDQLSKTLFPLGRFQKSEIRQIANEQNFINANKRDSQDICFVPDGDYATFISTYSGDTKSHKNRGNFIDSITGQVIGTHDGQARYTIGQRKGLGLALPHTMYVKSKNAKDNTVTLCQTPDELYESELFAKDFNWISINKPQIGEQIRCMAKIRYNQKEQPATAVKIDDSYIKITFDTPQRAIAVGQAAVLYNGDVVVGGGVICTASTLTFRSG
ncbi:MAG: tRNA 2-thiouridine(34) synthase MnmA [Oscillospiraceae bacterium]|nr:tRNA 2-thiouridine(34) synthase MnmA [Oscillospiraceae bacterium]